MIAISCRRSNAFGFSVLYLVKSESAETGSHLRLSTFYGGDARVMPTELTMEIIEEAFDKVHRLATACGIVVEIAV